MSDGVPLLTRRKSMQTRRRRRSPPSTACRGCGDDDDPAAAASSGGKPSGTVTFGSNYSDPVPKKALAGRLRRLPDVVGRQGRRQHGRPQHVPGADQQLPPGHARRRVRLVRRLPHAVLRPAQAWRATSAASGRRSAATTRDAFKEASTLDGKQYFVPLYNYPWAIFYRKSVWEKNGYEPAANLDDFKALCEKIQKDGMTPIAFADKDGWPAMGTFDYINMRTNGYDFHKSLMARRGGLGRPGGQGRVRDVARAAALPRRGRARADVAGRGADAQTRTRRCTCSARSSASSSRARRSRTSTSSRSRRSTPSTARTRSRRRSTASCCPRTRRTRRPRSRCWSTSAARRRRTPTSRATRTTSPPTTRPTPAGTTPLQKKSAELISGAEQISQFLDRDTRPDFASTVMIPALQQFIKNPDDIDGLTKSIEQQKKTIFV